jgi:hypothetical protein
MKREESYVRVSKWQGGKLSEQVYPASKLILFLIIFIYLFFFSYRNGTNIVELLST